MSQKTLLSFFKSPKSNGVAKEAVENVRKSPVKKLSSPVKDAIEKETDLKKSPVKNVSSEKCVVKESPVKQDNTEKRLAKTVEIPPRKTARKSVGGAKAVKASAKADVVKSLPSTKAFFTNGKQNDTDAKEAKIESCSLEEDDSPVKQIKKRKACLDSDSGESEEEVTQSSKKSRKNVITDDSPVKTTRKSARKIVLSEEEEEEPVIEEKNVNGKSQPKKDKENSKPKDENSSELSESKVHLKTTPEDKKNAKRSPRGRKKVEKSPVEKKAASQSEEEEEMEISTEKDKEDEVEPDAASESPDKPLKGKTPTKENKGAKKSPKSNVKSTRGRKATKASVSEEEMEISEENSTPTESVDKSSKSKEVAKTPAKGKKDAKKSPRGRKSNAKSPKEKKATKASESAEEDEAEAPEEKEVKDETKKEEPPKSSAIHSFFIKKDKESDDGKSKSKTEKKGGEEYNPSKSHYHPIDDACWKRGEKVPYLALARTLEVVEAISARLKMIEILANYFRSVIVLSPEDLLNSVYLCLNRIAPEYEGIEMGVGDSLLMKAVAQATGRTVEKIKAEVATKGDLGLVAESSRGNQRVMFAFPKLTVSSVFAKFKEIAQMSGNSAMSKKTDKIQALFSACRQSEARYIIRSLSGKLRIGLAEQSILAALAQACFLTPPNQDYPPSIMNASSKLSAESYKKKLEAHALILKTTYCECPNYDLIIPVVLKEGIEELPNHCQLKAGVPLKPMLAHPTKGIDEVLQRFDTNEFTCEFKYDGERAQIHLCESGDIKIYSRNQEDNTTKYPDVISSIRKAFKDDVKSFILDSEVVAWDRETNEILPFQILSTRKRKDVSDDEIKVQVCIMAFDLLYINGESLVRKSLRERRSLLKEHFVEVAGKIAFAQSMDGNNADVMQEFLDESIKGKCEGLMVKSLDVDASYEIAKRSHNWLKLKKDYLEGVGDTLDLVVIGGWYGKGKRAGYFGGFLLACYDDETEEFQTICKLGTGLKDEDLDNFAKFYKDHIIPSATSYFRYDSSLEPDAWFEPVQVWEIKCADLSISPIHKAGIGIVDPDKGISLRFPRFMRIRDDKKPEDATTASQVAKMYNSQSQIQNQKKTTKTEEEDFY